MAKLKQSKLSRQLSQQLFQHFIAGTTARVAADLVGVHKNSAALYFHKLRKVIAMAAEIENEQEPWHGEVELDESYFGGKRKGKRGRGAAGKIPVFGILKRGGKVYTQIIPDAKRTTLLPIIKQKILPDSIVYTDSLRSYATLNIEGFHHYRINHSKVLAKGHNHINGIENFWNQAKRHLRKFNGIPKEHFYLFLKECEWRFNYGKPKNLAKVLTNWVKLYS